MRLLVLSSGSKGNAAIIERNGRGILVDCGICKRDFMARCDDVHFDPACIDGVLITHEHSDHTKGLGVVLRGLASQGAHPMLYVSDAVMGASDAVQAVVGADLCERENMGAGDCVGIAGIQAHVFATSHDSVESYGFRFEADDRAIGFMTDSGIVLPAAHEALCSVDVLALESNHDLAMLHEGDYPYWLKQRVEGERGHLSNDQAADELTGLLDTRLHDVVAMHISQNNNTFGIPVRRLQSVLDDYGHSAHVQAGLQSSAVEVTV